MSGAPAVHPPHVRMGGLPATWTIGVLVAASVAFAGLVLTARSPMNEWSVPVMWLLMVPAMMLPATLPAMSIYHRAVADRRRTCWFTVGYAVVWVASAAPAWGLSRLIDRASESLLAAPAVTAVLFTVNGAFQLTGAKQRCLAVCRVPLGRVLGYLAWTGLGRDIRAGGHHAAVCLGCCATLMVLMVTVAMAPGAMLVIAAVVLIEKATTVGRWFTLATGVMSLALATAFAVFPQTVPAWLLPASAMHGMTETATP